MIEFGKPMAALIVLAIAAIIIGDFVSPVTPVEPPETHDYFGPGCYCHNQGLSIYVNGSDVYALKEPIYVEVESGRSFALLVASARILPAGILQPVMGWMPDMTDNAVFTFDPEEVRDDSPDDQAPRDGSITALFKVTAPNEPGSYTLTLSVQGPIVSVLVRVGAEEAPPPVPPAFASITDVEAPLLVQEGGSVVMNVSLRNTGSTTSGLYAYATDSATGEEVFPRLHSDGAVAPNSTVTLNAVFLMPNRTVNLLIRSGHVQEGVDADDDLRSLSVQAPIPLPPVKRPSLYAMVEAWGVWVFAAGASLATVHLVRSYGGRLKQPLMRMNQKLTFTIVGNALCDECEATIATVDEHPSFTPAVNGVQHGPVDVAFFVGQVRTEEDVRAARMARENARLLVAFGACSAFGGGTIETSHHMTEMKPLSEYVKVDLVVPGCPPPRSIVRDIIHAILQRSSDQKSER